MSSHVGTESDGPAAGSCRVQGNSPRSLEMLTMIQKSYTGAYLTLTVDDYSFDVYD